MSALLGFAGDAASLAVGIAMSLALWWFILSFWLDDAKLILGSVGITAAFYGAGALFAPGMALGSRLLLLFAIAGVAAMIAKYWLWRDSRKYGPRNG